MRRHLLAASLVATLALAAGCHKSSSAPWVPPAGSTELTQAYPSPSNLFTAHYPADFAARVGEKKLALLISRHVAGHDEFVTMVANQNPISTDLDEYLRVFSLAAGKEEQRQGAVASETGRKKSTCFGVPCVEVESTWTPGTTVIKVPYRRYQVTFIKDGHGYRFEAAAPESRADEVMPTLRKILDATTFNG